MARLLTYDLGSENTKELSTTEAYNMVHSVRVLCTQWLHKLGTQTTESVLFVPECREDRIKETIERVERSYRELNKRLKEQGLKVELEPILVVHKVATYQVSVYKKLAERAIVKKISKAIEDLEGLRERLDGENTPSKRRRNLYNVNRQIKAWEDIAQILDNLDIIKPEHYNQLMDLMQKTRAEIQG
jgi:hypothetical protein